MSDREKDMVRVEEERAYRQRDRARQRGEVKGVNRDIQRGQKHKRGAKKS